MGFPGGSAGKESAFNVGDLGLIPGLPRHDEDLREPLLRRQGSQVSPESEGEEEEEKRGDEEGHGGEEQVPAVRRAQMRSG